jgi:ubiquinone/menaquinone biosynthesis C-methylase UbiE
MRPEGLLSTILTKALAVFFRLLYHQFAWSYDLVAAIVSLGRWRSWVNSVLPYLDASPILELGFGPGHLQANLRQRGRLVCGLDASRWMCGLAVRRVESLGFDAMLVNGYAQFVPFSDACFARIVATFPSEYIFEPATAAEIRRLLQPGGALLVLPLAWITGSAWVDRLAAWLFRATYQAPAHLNESLIENLSKPFKDQGLVVEPRIEDLGTSQVLLILAHKPIEQ